MIHIDESRCAMCKREFDPPRVVKWGMIGFDLKHHLQSWEKFADNVVTRVEAPICGQCFEPLVGDVRYISMHPKDVALLPPAEARASLTGGLDALLGIPIVTDDELEPGRMEIRYRGAAQHGEVD